MKFWAKAAIVAGLLVLGAVSATAADLEVRITKLGGNGAEMVFEPALSRIAVGDTVTFIPCDKALNVETIAGMLPQGAARIKGQAGEKVAVTFTVPGTYGFKSKQQYAQGMVGMVVVGDTDVTTAQLQRGPRAAQTRFEAIIASQQ